METALYASLTRQSGLMREMDVIAHNIANLSTSGFRREGVVFAEHVAATGLAPSVSMAHATGRHVDLSQAGLTQTGGALDLAIQGQGFFQVDTPDGPMLTRAGAFVLAADGAMVTPDGHALLDAGGSAVQVPPGGGAVVLAQDGTLSVGGAPVARIGLVLPADPLALRHHAGTLFTAGETLPAEDATLHQGFLEDSNVNPVSEIARMISVQRAYEIGQSLMDREDERIRGVIQTLGR